MRTCALLTLAAALCVAHADKSLCVLPAFGDDGGKKCASHKECCGAAVCVKQRCQMTETKNAVEAAYLAHLIASDSETQVRIVTDYLNSAAEGIAVASDKIKQKGSAVQESAKELLESSKKMLDELKSQAAAATSSAEKKLKQAKADAMDAVRTKAEKATADMNAAIVENKAQTMTPEQKKKLEDLKAQADAAMDALAAELKQGSQAVKSSAESAAEKNPNLKGAAEKVSEKADTVAAKSTDIIEKIKAKYAEIMRNITAKANVQDDTSFVASYTQVSNKKAEDPAPAAGGFDFKGFIPGGSSGGSSSSPGAFDYKKFMPGASSSEKSTKKTSNAAVDVNDAKAAAGPSGAFDYSKYTPGGGAAAPPKGGASKKGSSGGAAPGGFDYGKFMGASKLSVVDIENADEVNDAGEASNLKEVSTKFKYSKFLADIAKDQSKGKMPFDWSKYSGGSKLATNDAKDEPSKKPTPSQQQGGSEGQQEPGAEGSPCGMTPYKDFGPCNAGLKCQTTPMFSSFAPGKCTKKAAPAVAKIADAQEDVNSAKSGAPLPGKKGGPCGMWELADVDFGKCEQGLECQASEATLKFKGKSFDVPSVCGEASTTMLAEDVNNAVEVSQVEDAQAGESENPEDLKAAAEAVALEANKAALQAADAAEVLAAKLVAAAAQVREAANKLMTEAKAMQEEAKAGTENKAAEVSMVADDTHVSSSHWLLYGVGLAVVAAVMYTYSKKQHSYHRI